MTQIETWVNDKLHDILGISDKYIAQYLIGLAKKSSSADEYVEKLRDTGTVEIDQNMVIFSQELWQKACILDWYSDRHLYFYHSFLKLRHSISDHYLRPEEVRKCGLLERPENTFPPENAGKHRKTPENTKKCRITHEWIRLCYRGCY